jgi:hypothetical protein
MRSASVLAALAVLLAPCGVALADGDPASDVLLGQDVFLPYSQISSRLERQLYAVCDAARRDGYPLKVALIAARSDLGVVPALFDKPQAYARFLSAELSSVVAGPVLVVMPSGFGLAVQGHQRSVSALAGVHPGAGADALATAALSAIRRLAASAGRPLGSIGGGSSAGASPATIRHAVTAMLVLAALAALWIGAALRARARH